MQGITYYAIYFIPVFILIFGTMYIKREMQKQQRVRDQNLHKVVTIAADVVIRLGKRIDEINENILCNRLGIAQTDGPYNRDDEIVRLKKEKQRLRAGIKELMKNAGEGGQADVSRRELLSDGTVAPVICKPKLWHH